MDLQKVFIIIWAVNMLYFFSLLFRTHRLHVKMEKAHAELDLLLNIAKDVFAPDETP